jgi:ribosomal protein S18 acetylase RimI-like enzyme
MAEIVVPVKPGWMDTVVIRNVREADLVGLEWEGEYAHFRRLYQDAYRRALRGLSVLWVAELPDGPGLIGQVFIQMYCDRPELCNGIDRAYLYGFRIRPAYRSCGLGSRILEVAERDLVERGYTLLTLNVARDNIDAIRLYQRRDFMIVAPEPGRWQYIDDKGKLQDVHEPAWRMEKRLAGA